MHIFVYFCLGSHRVKGGDVSKMNEATQYSKSTAYFLKNIFDTENPILINFPVWGQVSPVGMETPEVSKVKLIHCVLFYCKNMLYLLRTMG